MRKLKPTTSSQRYAIVDDYKDITATKPEKSLTTTLKKTGGRNNRGKMTMRYRGGGSKRKYRFIDFKRNKDGIEGVVKTIEYDPNRTSRIALIFYKDGEKRYILAPKGLKVNDIILSGNKEVAPELGNAMPLSQIPLGTLIHNIELYPGKGGKVARSAGCYARLSNKEGKVAVLKMSSGEVRQFDINCRATIGVLSNSDHNLLTYGKAGRKRWLGRRPRTRAVAMNPVDHPMGGGEGKASGGHPRSRKGIPAKGFRTRKKKFSDRWIIERRKK